MKTTTAPFNTLLQDASPRLSAWMRSNSGRIQRILGRFRFPDDSIKLMRPFNPGSVVVIKKTGQEGVITEVLDTVDSPNFITEYGRYEVYVDGVRYDFIRSQLKLKRGSRLRKLKDTPTGKVPA